MSKLFFKSKLVIKLPKDDPECVYVNKMMGMSTDLLRDMCSKNGENFDKMHGVVPNCKLPSGFDFGIISNLLDKPHIFDSKENKINSSSQNSSNSNSTLRMEVDDLNLNDEKKNAVIETVTNDLRLSSDEDEDNENDGNIEHIDNLSENLKDDSEKIFETLNKCSSKIPRVNSFNLFRKHYGNSKPDNNMLEINSNGKKDPPRTDETEPLEDSNESTKRKPHDVMKFIELLSSSKPEIKLSTFEPIYNEINRKRQAMKMQREVEMATQPKQIKYLVEKVKDSMVLRVKIIPELAKAFDLKGASEKMKKLQLLKECKYPSSTVKPNYVSQESFPFSKSDNLSKDFKPTEKCSTNSNLQQLFNSTMQQNECNAIKKPQAAAKQIFPHSNYNNSTKVAVVTGKINKASSSLHNVNNSTTNTPLSNQQIIFQSIQQKTQQKSKLTVKDPNQRIINTNENEADEQKVVEGLKAIDKLRQSIKSDFIARLRALDTEKWLSEADGYKESANRFKGRLEYTPLIILAFRKYLIYNYSLDVQEQGKKCHETYMKNAEFVCQISRNLEQVYKDHISKIQDQNSLRLWNLKLIKWFTMTMCMKLSAILQYRAFRNVSTICKDVHSYLRMNGILDRDGRTSTLVTENNQSISPFSVLSSYSPGRNSSPRGTTPANHRTIVNATAVSSNHNVEIKAKLQQYIEFTGIINNSYSDWMRAEINHAKFCEKSARHEEAWKEIEWKIIEKTGGITINGIDESMAFVIKYLEGFVNYMNEFQKNWNPPRSSDSRLIS